MILKSLQGFFQLFDISLLRDLLLRLASTLVCLTIHETCHGLAAYALGDPTAKRKHRLSLNPLRHIDWFGFASMLLLGFGWAKPVPVDMRYFKKPKQGMALTALAGPMSNLLLTFFLLGVIRFLLFLGLPWQSFLIDFCLVCSRFSIGLAVFNLLPIPPLDGSKVLLALLPQQLYQSFLRYERFGLLFLYLFVTLPFGNHLLSSMINILYQWMVSIFF